MKSLQEVGFHSATDMLATYAGRASELGPWLKGAQINADLNMRLQYLAGMGVNGSASAPIYSEMLGYRKFPGDLFTGSEQRIQG